MKRLSGNHKQDIKAILISYDHPDKLLQLFMDSPLSVNEIEKFFKWHMRSQLQTSYDSMEWELYQYIDELSGNTIFTDEMNNNKQAYEAWLAAHNNAAIESSWNAVHNVV